MFCGAEFKKRFEPINDSNFVTINEFMRRITW
jgi:hypothetical protein